MDAAEAAPRAINAYLGAYGPATPTQLRNWLARGRISGRQLKHWFGELADSLTKIDVDGDEMLIRTEDVDSLANAKSAATVRLLGGFEQWVLGPGTDDTHIIPAGRRSAVSRTSGWIAPIAVVGGVVSGTWSFEAQEVVIEWFAECGPPPMPELETEASRLSARLGRPLSLAAVKRV
jgi:hypothetical protein